MNGFPIASQADLANKDRWVVARNEGEAKAMAAEILGVDKDKVLYFVYNIIKTLELLKERIVLSSFKIVHFFVSFRFHFSIFLLNILRMNLRCNYVLCDCMPENYFGDMDLAILKPT